MNIKHHLKWLPPLLLALGLGALLVVFPYVFPTPSTQTLFEECTRKCAKFNALGNLEKVPGPYSPKSSPRDYVCRCT